MSAQPKDPVCTRWNCEAPNHCHVHRTHHCVDSMADWCAKRHEEEEKQ